MGIGLLSLFFFLKYKGTAIPMKEFWFVLSIFILIAGAYLLAKYKLQHLKNERNDSNSNRLANIEQLKRTGDKVRVTLDNAEVKSRNYQEEVINEGMPSRMEIVDALYDGNRNYKTREVQQTYIVFYKQYGGKTYKFVSQPTTQNAEVVRLYIDQRKGVNLYIDLHNPANYYFELPYV